MNKADRMRHGNEGTDSSGILMRARACHGRFEWGEAHRLLLLADEAAPLAVDDLERLATAAFMLNRDDDFMRALDRAHHMHLDGGEYARAIRCAFWLGLRLMLRGEMGPGSGWLARAERLVQRSGKECVEPGYLLLPVAEQQIGAKEFDVAFTTAVEAAAYGQRFADADLTACALHLQGRARIRQGRIEAGLRLLDEAMVAVVAGELSPIVTGLVYCSVVEACQEVYALRRAREWTSALAQWCQAQPELRAFTGTCLVHRAEILQMQGAWPDALDEARRACAGFQEGLEQRPPAAALYQQGEVHRLRGDFAAAEEAYREASRWGCDPQPGMALLRLAEGRAESAAAAMRRALGATSDPLERARLLPAHVEIMLAVGDLQAARAGCEELGEIARRFQTRFLTAAADHVCGAVELAEGNPNSALGLLRKAFQAWQQLDSPYLAARSRELLGLACRALGDEEGGGLELEAARAAYVELGAAPDVARLDSHSARRLGSHGLSQRELQVLRLVADGKTNKAIAAELSLSERTVDRHLSNILVKLDVPSRAAATAYGYQHKLI